MQPNSDCPFVCHSLVNKLMNFTVGTMVKLLLAIFFLQYYFYFFSEANQSVAPEQVHIAFGDTPTEVVVTWNTQAKTPNAYVEYGSALEKRRVEGQTKVFTDGGRSKRIQYVHRVYLKNLQPSMRYVYICGSSLGVSEKFWFKTVPNGTNWSPKLAIFGDMGEKKAVSLPFLEEEALSNSFDAFIHVGDFAYDMKDKSGKKGDKFMKMIEPIAAHVPYMVCPGNHEQHYNFSHFKERFTMPGTKDNLYYSFNLGPAHFISIDTEFYFYYMEYGVKQVEYMYEWLENDLKEANVPNNRSIRPWIITYGHRPMYCSNTNHGCLTQESRVRTGLDNKWFGLEDLFYKYGVDVSMWGHEHSYERLLPVYNHTLKIVDTAEPYVDPGAPVHITTGSAGCWESLSDFSEKTPTWSASRLSLYGYSTMRILNKTHLLIQEHAIHEGGKYLADEVMIVKNKHRYGSSHS